jgi:hypothetical protein
VGRELEEVRAKSETIENNTELECLVVYKVDDSMDLRYSHGVNKLLLLRNKELCPSWNNK